MVNHLHRRRLNFCFVFVCLVCISGCASRSVALIHPQSGATMNCSATGYGLIAGFAEGFVEECVRNYKSKGYVPEDELSPLQRSDLEKRGVLPIEKPSKDSERPIKDSERPM